ncbi:MAG: PaaI family thioesterase [Lachnospiraceae bacterium]|nr:PaaI family thioesterase [Lachnospiraceae bacterium]
MSEEYCNYLMKKYNSDDPLDEYSSQLGVRLLECRDGWVKTVLPVTGKITNPLGTVHGGCLFSLADTSAGITNMTVGKIGPTISSNIEFMHAFSGSKNIYCEAEHTHCGRTVSFISLKIYGDNGVVGARGSMVYSVHPYTLEELEDPSGSGK